MSTNHPKRRVFYSFHFDNDAWRAGQVRNIGVTEHDEPVSDNAWEQVKRGGDDAIRKWINDQMATRSCVIVLIGSQTANRKWINYEIARAWDEKKGLLGIHIHRLLNQDSQAAAKGSNPFNYVKLNNGLTIANYPKIATVYDPPHTVSQNVYAHIRNNLEAWVENAIRNRRQ